MSHRPLHAFRVSARDAKIAAFRADDAGLAATAAQGWEAFCAVRRRLGREPEERSSGFLRFLGGCCRNRERRCVGTDAAACRFAKTQAKGSFQAQVEENEGGTLLTEMRTATMRNFARPGPCRPRHGRSRVSETPPLLAKVAK